MLNETLEIILADAGLSIDSTFFDRLSCSAIDFIVDFENLKELRGAFENPELFWTTLDQFSSSDRRRKVMNLVAEFIDKIVGGRKYWIVQSPVRRDKIIDCMHDNRFFLYSWLKDGLASKVIGPQREFAKIIAQRYQHFLNGFLCYFDYLEDPWSKFDSYIDFPTFFYQRDAIISEKLKFLNLNPDHELSVKLAQQCANKSPFRKLFKKNIYKTRKRENIRKKLRVIDADYFEKPSYFDISIHIYPHFVRQDLAQNGYRGPKSGTETRSSQGEEGSEAEMMNQDVQDVEQEVEPEIDATYPFVLESEFIPDLEMFVEKFNPLRTTPIDIEKFGELFCDEAIE